MWGCSWAGRPPRGGGGALCHPGLWHKVVSEVPAAEGGGAAGGEQNKGDGAEAGRGAWAEPEGEAGEAGVAGVAGHELGGDLGIVVRCVEGGAEHGGVGGGPAGGGVQVQAQAGCWE